MEDARSYEKKTNLRNRLILFTLIVQAFFIIMIVRLWFLQILKHDFFQKLSLENRTRILSVEAPRGHFYDRNNFLLVVNRPAFSIAIIPEDIKENKKIIHTLNRLLDLDQNEIKNKMKKHRYGSFKPLRLKHDVGEKIVAIVEENKENYPGVMIMVEPRRSYNHGRMGAHLFGNMGEINDKELKMDDYKEYQQGDIIGKTGLEKVYEKYLKGINGLKRMEVSAKGQQISSKILEEPVPGHNIVLTIDKELQEIAEEEMKGKTGSIVAINPGNGEILAMVSKPDFDPNMFTGQISPEDWNNLNNNPKHPLINRSVMGAYPPGSTFKIISAIAALEEEIIDIDDVDFCNGEYQHGTITYKCWKKYGHGQVNVSEALIHSCNVFFYKLGLKLGAKKIEKYAKKFGLNKKTGIDLVQERSGLVPNPKWKNDVMREPWYPGDDISMAIGQGALLVTPLQMANLISSIANNNLLYRPYLVKSIIADNGKVVYEAKASAEKIKISKKTMDIIKDALWKVVNRAGTGRRTRIPGLNIIGKTGTAQIVAKADIYDDVKTNEIPEAIRPHAWFVSCAPLKNPKIAIAILIEHGGEGGQSGAPIAKKMYDAYLENEKREYSLDSIYNPKDVPVEELHKERQYFFNSTYINKMVRSFYYETSSANASYYRFNIKELIKTRLQDITDEN